MLTSVIIPCHNSEGTVARAIQSAVRQEGCSLEIIVIDDASTDGSRQVLKSLERDIPMLQVVHLQECQGAGNARNVGIELASGEYIAFLDADDTWVDGKLARQIEYMEKHNVGFSCTQYERLCSATGSRVTIQVPSVFNYHQALKCNPIGTSTAVIRSNALGSFRFSFLRRRQDYLLWLTILKQGSVVHAAPFVGTVYSHGSPSSLSANRLKSVKYNWRVLNMLKVPFWLSIYYLLNQIIRSFAKNQGRRWW